MTASRADRSLAWVALLLVALAVWAIQATCRVSQSVPDDAAWQRAAALVRAEVAPGDLIVFAPPWVDPVGRLHLGDLISLRDVGRMDAAHYRRVWVLAIRGADAPEVSGERAAQRRDLDGISVRRYDRDPAALPVVLDDAANALPSAHSSGALQRGPSVELTEVGFVPRRCVQVVPAAGGSVRIAFPRMILGSELVGYVGLADVFTRRDVREPGQLAVEIAGQVVVRQSIGVEDGWVRFSARTSAGVAAVTVIASAPARDRLICFAMESRQ